MAGGGTWGFGGRDQEGLELIVSFARNLPQRLHTSRTNRARSAVPNKLVKIVIISEY